MSQSHKINSYQAIKSIYSTHGFFNGYFKGMKYSYLFHIVSYFVYFPIYELGLKALSMQNTKQTYVIGDISKENKNKLSSLTIGIAGGIAGVMSWIIGYPLDTIKTRVQSGFYTDQVSINALRRNYTLSYNGIKPAIYRAAVLHSCVFLVYERVLQIADQYNDKYDLFYL